MTYHFTTASDLLELVKSRGLTMEEFCIEREAFLRGVSKAVIYNAIEQRIIVMKESLKKGIETPQKSYSGLTRGSAHILQNIGVPIIGDTFFHKAVQYSLAIAEVNACRGKIVSYPTAGSCGIIPGVLLAYSETHSIPGEILRRAFIIASLFGIIIGKKVHLAGAEAGCQAECGAASSMAAAGLASIMSSEPELTIHAAALALKNSLGLVCDPVAGLVEVPCVKRNAFHASHAITAAFLALNGVQSIIPFDEIISAMKSIGQQLPSTLKESAQGGLAKTPTGLKYQESLL